jgi:hypothetical protein
MKTKIAALAAGLLIAGAAGAQELLSGYTCCNLHYDKDWISDANWGNLPMIPAGTPIKVVSYSAWNHRAAVEIDGRPYRIGHDYGRAEEPLEKYVSKLVVKASPKAKIQGWPEKVRSAVRDSRVLPGMTREQVIVSVGYPPTHKTRSTDERVWNLWQSRAGRYEVHFTDKGTVDKVVGR